MKKYRFRLATVLRVRRIEEEQARAVLMQANHAVTAANAEVHAREEALAARNAAHGTMSREAFLALQGQGARLAEAVRTASARRAEALAIQAARRAEWSLRAQRVSSLERLDERQHEAYAIELNREEIKVVDDLVTNRFGRQERRQEHHV
ncbi:MAG: flagellar export protein FliJ [Acidimicrobiia bacterium]